MPRIKSGVLALAIAFLVASASAGQEKPVTPADEYKALLKQHSRAASGGPFTDEERLKFVGRAYQFRHELGLKFLALAEKYPRDPVAVDALIQAVWQVNTIPWPVELVGEDRARKPALELLERNHLQSDKLGALCARISHGFCQEYETFLRAVRAKSPHESVRAEASVALAHFLYNRRQRLDLLQDELTLAREFAGLYGQKYLDELKRQDRTASVNEAESLFEESARKYAGVKLHDGDTVAERAKVELFAIRHLSVGCVAPDIAGMDQDGKQFRLGDYRGKVVLLDFWSQV